jgi:SOS response regulatory protein OraA/RecX
LGYLNDEAYAQRWAGVKLARRPMGRDRLEAELLAQGLDRATVSRTLEKIYSRRNERDLARLLLSRRIGSGTGRTDAARAGLLRRYGFREELIEELLSGGQCS